MNEFLSTSGMDIEEVMPVTSTSMGLNGKRDDTMLVMGEAFVESQLEQQEEAREERSRDGSIYGRDQPLVKLEVAKRWTIRKGVTMLVLTQIVCLVLGVVTIIKESAYFDFEFSNGTATMSSFYQTDPNTWAVYVHVNFSMWLLATVIQMFLMLSYPLRIIRAAKDPATPIVEEQFPLVFLVCISMTAPAFNFIGVVMYGLQIFRKGSDPANIIFFARSWLYYDFGSQGPAFTALMSWLMISATIYVVYFVAYIGSVIEWQGECLKTKRANDYRKEMAKIPLDQDHPPFDESATSTNNQMEIDEKQLHIESLTGRKRDKSKQKKKFNYCCSMDGSKRARFFYYAMCCFFCLRPHEWERLGKFRAGWHSKWLLVVGSLYWVCVTVFTTVFDFAHSAIPFVGIVTVIRVCATSDVKNGTPVSVCLVSSGDINVIGRIASVCVLTILEIIMAVLLIDTMRNTRKELRKADVVENRARFLSNKLVSITFLSVWFVIFIISLVAVFYPNAATWFIVAPVDSSNCPSDFCVQVDPLYRIGVTVNSVYFGYIALLIELLTFFICTAYLPPDSKGVAGYFVPTPPKKGCAKFENQYEQPKYRPKVRPGDNVIQQILNHEVVMETEALLFELAYYTYVIKRSQETFPGITFVAHIHIDETDSHVVVFRGSDRVIIAFRGTVSNVNIKSDLKIRKVEFELATQVELQDTDLEYLDRYERAAVARPPMVHQGFYLAYQSVITKLHECVDPIIEEIMEQQYGHCGVFFTGHSLGGSLATLCSFDFAVTYREQREQRKLGVALTTFGSPRVGTFSYKIRHEKLVPSTKRWVVAGDIITSLPPSKPVWNATWKFGFHHVGILLLMDLDGNLLVSPSLIELTLLNGISVFEKKTSHHLCSRYCLGMLAWCLRFHQDEYVPRFSCALIDSVSKNCMPILQNMNPTLQHGFHNIVRISHRVGKAFVKTRETQTEEFSTASTTKQQVLEYLETLRSPQEITQLIDVLKEKLE